MKNFMLKNGVALKEKQKLMRNLRVCLSGAIHVLLYVALPSAFKTFLTKAV
jgi:hypothetical protein